LEILKSLEPVVGVALVAIDRAAEVLGDEVLAADAVAPYEQDWPGHTFGGNKGTITVDLNSITMRA
jgi:hypothetical protein